MRLVHWMRNENSGLMHTTLELCEEEQRQGHEISIREPSNANVSYGFNGTTKPDVHVIHSQFHPSAYHANAPRFMIMHGEPLGSVGNGISMRAIVDLAPAMDAFICMRKEEWPVWNAVKRTHLVKKGIDLEKFKPAPTEKKLSGNPAILYYENWRGQRNPLLLCVAMLEIIKVFPEAKLHLYNCPGGKLYETFQKLINHSRWYTFIGSLKGQEKDVPALLNRADIVVSCLYPLYARGIEAFGCGKPFISPGYREHDYPYQCDLEPLSMAKAIERCWHDHKDNQEFSSMHFRKWAEQHHNVADTIKESIAIYERYV